MIDQTVVMLTDLSDDEAELAWRNRRREADNISRLTGCEVELRREGIALIDHPTQPISHSPFPGSTAIAHAALLWLSALLDSVDCIRPAPPQSDDDSSSVRAEYTINAETAEAAWASVLAEYAKRLSQDARQQPERFRADVAALLQQHRLVVARPDGVAVTAFANRFRAQPTLVGGDLTEPAQQVMF